MLDNDLIRHGLEFARAIDNHQYEVTPEGLHFPRQRALVAGQFTTWINGADRQVDPNIVPAQGLAQILKSGIGTGGYIAPFTGSAVPLSTLTAATFNGVLTEFVAYDEPSRPVWTIPADPAAGVYSNSAAPAIFTANASVGTGAGVDVYGAALLTVLTKGATTGLLICASKFSGTRNLKTGDKLTVQYDISTTSTT